MLFTGFELTNNGQTCEDMDECAHGLDSCSDICENTQGSFLCSCHEGRVLAQDAVSCVGEL